MAASKAVQLMQSRIDDFDRQVASVKAVTYEGLKAYYVVQFAPEGWVLISADDTSAPIFGYNTTGKFQTEDMPFNMQAQMDIYSQQIIHNADKYYNQHPDWKSVDARTHRAARRAGEVKPLIKVNWNQTGKFQKYCPKNATGQAVVGCVAVGMAQAMSVAQWPEHATGDFGYQHQEFGYLHINYDEEPAYDWGAILSGANNFDDVARLLWHCGVSVKMDYGVSGSGTQTSYIPSALQNYFKYPSSVRYYSRSAFSDDDWKTLILTEIQEGRAVAYSGHDPKKGYGHCFNLDGYDGTWFNVNWGWGGANNGYFSLDALHDATMDMDYTDGQGVVIGIRPPSEYPMNILLSSTSVAATASVGTVVANVIVESEATNPTYTFTLKGPVNPITHKATTPPFEVKDMQLVTTKDLTEKAGKTEIFSMTVKNNENGHELTRDFAISIVNSAGIVSITSADVTDTSYFTIDGRKLQAPQKGLNIVRQRTNDGQVTAHKVIMK